MIIFHFSNLQSITKSLSDSFHCFYNIFESWAKLIPANFSPGSNLPKNSISTPMEYLEKAHSAKSSEAIPLKNNLSSPSKPCKAKDTKDKYKPSKLYPLLSIPTSWVTTASKKITIAFTYLSSSVPMALSPISLNKESKNQMSSNSSGNSLKVCATWTPKVFKTLFRKNA